MLRSLVDFLAKMGLAVRDDPPRVIDFDARQWGEPASGWVLSAESIPGRERGDLPALSVVIRNVSEATQKLTVPGWLHFYRLEMRNESGRRIDMAPFGKTALDPARRTGKIEAILEPGGWTETLIPLGSFFNLRGQRGLNVTASGPRGDGVVLVSNTTPV